MHLKSWPILIDKMEAQMLKDIGILRPTVLNWSSEPIQNHLTRSHLNASNAPMIQSGTRES